VCYSETQTARSITSATQDPFRDNAAETLQLLADADGL
jgi:hypothetical protein